VEIAVWVLAAILALNALVVLSYVAFAARRRFRIWREVRLLESLWRTEARLGTGVERRVGGTLTVARPAAASAVRRRPGRAIAALGAAMTLAWGAVTVLDPDPREVLDSAMSAVIQGIDAIPTPFTAATDESQRAAARRGAASAGAAGSGTTRGPAGGASASQIPSASAAPKIVLAAPAVTVVQLVWADVPAADSYAIERSEDGVTDWRTLADEVTETTYVDTGLAGGTTYYYRVSAVIEGGETVASQVFPVTTILATPTDVVATVEGGAVRVTWSDVAGETGYRVERSVDVGDWTTIATVEADVTEQLDVEATPATTYHYRVVALGETESSGASPSATVTVPADGPSPDPGTVPPSDGGSDGGADSVVVDDGTGAGGVSVEAPVIAERPTGAPTEADSADEPVDEAPVDEASVDEAPIDEPAADEPAVGLELES
jgi:hypothetical protein